MKTGLESLDVGAPEITYSGNQGPKSPQEDQQKMQEFQMAQLEEEYDAYVDDMMEQGIEPMSMQQFLQQIAAEAQMSSNEQGGMGDIPMEMNEGIGSMMQGPRTMAMDGGIMRTGFRGGGGYQGGGGRSSSSGSSGGPAGGATTGGGGGNNNNSGGGNNNSGGGNNNSGGGGNQNTGNAREDYITNYVSKGKVKGGGSKKTGTVDTNNDGRDDRTGEDIYKDRTVTKEEIDRGQSNYQEQFNDIVTGSRPMGFNEKSKVAYQNRIYDARRANIINQLTTAGLLTDEDDDMTVEQLRDRFQNSTDTVGADYGDRSMKSFDEISTIQDMVDKGYYKKDGVFDKNSDIYDPSRIPTPFKKSGIPSLDAIGEIIAGPLTSEYLGKQFDELQDISGLTGDLYKDDNSIKRLMEKYEPNRYAVDYGETSGGGDGGGGQTNTGGGDGDDDDDTDTAIPTDPVTGQYSNQYLIPGGSNFYSNLPSNMFNQNTNMLTLADGGIANLRQGAAFGGMMGDDGRRAYGLGSIFKKITKPFKKAFKGFKKIAKSPLGRMALLAMGGYYAGGGNLFGLQRAGLSTPGFSMSNLPGANFFTGGSKAANLAPKIATRSTTAPLQMGVTKAKTALDGGNFLTKSLGFMKDNPFATITGLSTLSGLYTNYMNNKREDETMEEYNRRLEIERGNFAEIPTGPVQFAANGGRMGFMNGGDDDDDNIFFRGSARSDLAKAMSNPRMKRAMGGSTGMPPVTMMSEGQNIKSFSDDESSAMNQGPTMQSQMPMRPPMMDPRMMQQQGGMNSMMGNRMMAAMGGLMNLSGRMGYAEGGDEGELLDMGGLEKDYRNDGGFVPMGEYERKDDVPARLSKNEFVFTADAVRNAGGGDIDKGAEIMENMMENLEAGGKVSKGSQGLSGAREMFATQQRLGEVL